MKKQIESRKTIWFLTALNLMQIALVLGIALLGFLREDITLDRVEYIYLLIIGGVSVTGSILTIFVAAPISKLDRKLEMLGDSLTDINDLNHELRAQRHDFLNHLQVVYSLIELEDYQSAHNYIETVYKDIQKVSRVLKTAHPAVNAILQALSLIHISVLEVIAVIEQVTPTRTTYPKIKFIIAPASTTKIRFQTLILQKARGSSELESSPSMLQKPPIGKARIV